MTNYIYRSATRATTIMDFFSFSPISIGDYVTERLFFIALTLYHPAQGSHLTFTAQTEHHATLIKNYLLDRQLTPLDSLLELTVDMLGAPQKEAGSWMRLS